MAQIMALKGVLVGLVFLVSHPLPLVTYTHAKIIKPGIINKAIASNNPYIKSIIAHLAKLNVFGIIFQEEVRITFKLLDPRHTVL